MNPESDDIAVEPDTGTWMLVFLPFLMAAVAGEFFRRDINAFWWGPPLALITVLVLATLLRRPHEIVFKHQTQTMELRYRLGRKTRVLPFDALDSIQSYIKTSGENDKYVQLEIRLKDGERIAVKTEIPSWDGFLGLKGGNEPESLARLRRQIALLTGIKDVGFR